MRPLQAMHWHRSAKPAALASQGAAVLTQSWPVQSCCWRYRLLKPVTPLPSALSLRLADIFELQHELKTVAADLCMPKT